MLSICVLPRAVRGLWPESVGARSLLSEPLHPSASLGTLVTFRGCECERLFKAASGPARESKALRLGEEPSSLTSWVSCPFFSLGC